MAETINQPTGRPTNKTLAFLIGTVITNAAMRFLEANDLMQWLATDTETLRELVYMGVSVLIGLAAAYKVRDRANAPGAPAAAPVHSSDVGTHPLATLGAAGLALLLMGGLAGCAASPADPLAAYCDSAPAGRAVLRAALSGQGLLPADYAGQELICVTKPDGSAGVEPADNAWADHRSHYRIITDVGRHHDGDEIN